MFNFKVGDRVSVIHDNINGIVTGVNAQRVTITDSDGFTREYRAQDLSPHKPIGDYKLTDEQIERVINDQLEYHNVSILSKKGTESIRNPQESFEIDLHIEELVDNIQYLTEDTLTVQMRFCRIFMEKALQKKVKKALIIHGKGEGVLRMEIHKYLERLENAKHITIDFKVINNGGATEIYIK